MSTNNENALSQNQGKTYLNDAATRVNGARARQGQQRYRANPQRVHYSVCPPLTFQLRFGCVLPVENNYRGHSPTSRFPAYCRLFDTDPEEPELEGYR